MLEYSKGFTMLCPGCSKLALLNTNRTCISCHGAVYLNLCVLCESCSSTQRKCSICLKKIVSAAERNKGRGCGCGGRK